jgi:PAS domain S-box-containing protein
MSPKLPAFPDLASLPTGLFAALAANDVLALFEEITGAAFFAVDMQQNITAYSPGLASLTGFSAAEVVGRHCLKAIRCQECLRTCGIVERGWVDAVPLTLYRKDGTPVLVRKSGRLVHGPDGAPIGTLEMIVPLEEDGTVRTHGADGRAGQEEADNLLAVMGRYFVAVDASLRVMRCSRRLEELTGWNALELHGMTLVDLFGEELFGSESSFLAAVRSGERREGWRAQVLVKGGEPVPVSLSAAPIGQVEEEERPATCHRSTTMVIIFRPDVGSSTETAAPAIASSFSGIVARSHAMQRIFRLIDQLRDNDATVLITGESGTGKELVARAIHDRSHRARGPFVVVNCGALPNELLESELFGHVRGAFTGAIRDKPGRFELAEGGTILLDEIGDLPKNLQVKLLRVLQERTFERLGDPHTRTIDVRIIAATHIDLARAVAEERFREDLYYRLRVVPIVVPPLRERRDDIELLVHHFLPKIGRERGRSLRLSPSTMRTLLSHSWPGNVRELQNALEYATAVCEGQTVHVTDIPAEIGRATASVAGSSPLLAPISAALPAPAGPSWSALGLTPAEQSEAERIQQVLAATHYRKSVAAEQLGMSRTTLWRKMKQYRLG